MGDKYRMRCIGEMLWGGGPSFPKVIGQRPGCGWRGIRTDRLQCECYDLYAHYCRALTPGPGCPRGIAWPCPRCKGSVTGKLVERRTVSDAHS
jgi:hypothetical protein